MASERFKTYLPLGVAAVLVVGCVTGERTPRGNISLLRLHLEADAEVPDHTLAAPIYRQKPQTLIVEKAHFLDERNLKSAELVETEGGFAIRLEFDRRGATLLEIYSTRHRGRRFAICAQFGPKLAETRWLAAPVIGRRITDGVLVFTPDATREEAEQIVHGLNKLIRKTRPAAP